MLTIGDIYGFFDEIMPFSTQEEWDNSGLLVGNMNKKVNSVLVCLDITSKTVDEADRLNASLIVSHHPVIFSPIKTISADSVVYKLIERNISALCCHTNADKSDFGTNAAAYEAMCDELKLGEKINLPEYGFTASCEDISPEKLSEKLSMIFNTKVRFNKTYGSINKIVFCSGSGGFLLDSIKEESTALITGDVKHNIFVDADNRKIPVFDCTHYATEILFAEKTASLLLKKFPELNVKVSDYSKDYILFSV